MHRKRLQSLVRMGSELLVTLELLESEELLSAGEDWLVEYYQCFEILSSYHAMYHKEILDEVHGQDIWN
jgi:hypothetical protein